MSDELREALADYAHVAWAGWMQYLLRFGEQHADGSFTIQADKVARWKRQMQTAYSMLSEAEKDSDRTEADVMLSIMRPVFEERDALARERDAQERQIAGLRAALQACDEHSPQFAALHQAARAVLRYDAARQQWKAAVEALNGADNLQPPFPWDDEHRAMLEAETDEHAARVEAADAEEQAAEYDVMSAAADLRAAGLTTTDQ